MERECQSDLPARSQERNVGGIPNAQLLCRCSCGNASSSDHEGIYCSVVCAQIDAHEALIHGDNTSHYRRIQKKKRSLSPQSDELYELRQGTGSVTTEFQTTILRNHGYMSIDEWALAFEPAGEMASTTSNDSNRMAGIDGNAWEQAGKIARKQRAKKKARVDPNRSECEGLANEDYIKTDPRTPSQSSESLEAKAAVPLSSASPRRARGKAVQNIRPVLFES